MGEVPREGSLKKYEKIVILLTLIFNNDWRKRISITDLALNIYYFLCRKPSFIRDKIQEPGWITK